MGSLVQAGNNSLLSRLHWNYGQTASHDFHTRMWKRCEAGLTHRCCRKCVCQGVCRRQTMWSPMSDTHHVKRRFIPRPGQGLALQILSEESVGHIMFSSSQDTQTAKSPAQPKPSQRHLLSCGPRTHPNTVCSVAQTPLPPPSAEVRSSAQRKTTCSQTDQHPCADFENKQSIRMRKANREKDPLLRVKSIWTLPNQITRSALN